jgi:hypothetical protein
MDVFFACSAAALNVLASIFYVRSVLDGSARPNRVTWLLWAIAPLIAAAAQFASGVGISTLVILASGLLPLCVFAASFLNPSAYWKLTGFDYLCAGFAALALLLWALTRDAVIAIILSIVSDFLAALPTLRKCYTDPATEERRTYLIFFTSTLLGIFSITDGSFVGYAFNLYLLFITFVMTVTLYRDRLTAFLR